MILGGGKEPRNKRTSGRNGTTLKNFLRHSTTKTNHHHHQHEQQQQQQYITATKMTSLQGPSLNPPTTVHSSTPISQSAAHDFLTAYLDRASSQPALQPNASITEHGPVSRTTTAAPNLTIHNLKRVQAGLAGEVLGRDLTFAKPVVDDVPGMAKQEQQEQEQEQQQEQEKGDQQQVMDVDDEAEVPGTSASATAGVDKEERKRKKKERRMQEKRTKSSHKNDDVEGDD